MDLERRQVWGSYRNDMLREHNAVVRAAEEGRREPASYRPDALIIPAGLASSIGEIRKLVESRDVEIELPDPAAEPAGCPVVGSVRPRSADGDGDPAAAAVDAIRSDPALSGVSLDRLLMGCALIGEGPATAGHGEPGPWGYPDFKPERGGRVPVVLPKFIPVPTRPTVVDEVGNDRPVIAVLDTGLGNNTWLGIEPGQELDGGLLVADHGIQDEIRMRMMAQMAVATSGTTASPSHDLIFKDWRDTPWKTKDRNRDLDCLSGHGTFIVGILRDSAPEAVVRMIRVMYSDGIVYESAVVTALWRLHDRLVRAAKGEDVDRSELVDVVSLSFGGYFRDADEEREGSPLFGAIDALRKMGVVVVAAAGNFGSPDPFYPAAMAGHRAFSDGIPVVSVGALNPNGSYAAFSNYGDWVNYSAPGVSIISTLPEDMQGPLNATREYELPGGGTAETLDPDNFESGFAIWSGTSFATAFAAAEIANKLKEVGDLTDTSREARLDRAQKALAELGVPRRPGVDGRNR
jgi:hypothetical protein